jgi:hypothetical protein
MATDVIDKRDRLQEEKFILQLQKEDIDFSIRYLYEWVGELVERVIE